MSSEITQSFIDAMSAAGCAPHNAADIIPDGEDHTIRAAADKRDKRLGYCLTVMPDGFAYGNFIFFKTGDKGSWHSGKGVKTLSADERKANEARYKLLEADRKARVDARHAQAAIEASTLWARCEPAISHPYLERKGVQAHGARLDGDDLIYQAISGGKICTVQRIAPDGSKLFLTGGKKQGAFYPLTTAAEDKHTIIVCEGIATAASIREATGLPVVAAFDAGNLKPVTHEMRGKYPNAVIVIAADNDAGGEKNTGILSAQQAAVKTGAFVVWPEFEEGSELTDFNDAMCAHGVEYIKNKILSVMPPLTERKVAGGVSHTPVIDVQSSGHDIHADAPWIEPDDPESVQSGSLSPVFSDAKIVNTLLWRKWPSDGDAGKLEPNKLHNIAAFLRHKAKYQGLFRYDRFAGRVILASEPFYHDNSAKFKIRELRDSDLSYIKSSMEKEGLEPSSATVHEAINLVAGENWIDPPLDYFNKLKWDGLSRLCKWLQYYLGAEGDAEYLSAVGMAWLIALVARQFCPGAKCDSMLVLEGTQGLMKSTALKILADVGCGDDEESYFCDTLSFDQIKDKDSVLKMQGKTIIEMQEMAGLNIGEIEEVKARMGVTVDEIRVPYGRTIMKYPRRFVWAGSTNESHWLKDQTGNRRFWPVKCGKIDIKALRDDREQLFAEAVHLYKNKAIWWIGRDSAVWAKAQLEQQSRLLEDIWHAPVERFVECQNFVTVSDVLLHLKIEIKDQNPKNQRQVIGILKQLGFVSKTKRFGSIVRGWERVGSVIDAEVEELDL